MSKEFYIFENLNGGYFQADHSLGSVTYSASEMYIFQGTRAEAQAKLDQINEDCRENDNSDSRCCVRPNFFEFELKEIFL